MSTVGGEPLPPLPDVPMPGLEQRPRFLRAGIAAAVALAGLLAAEILGLSNPTGPLQGNHTAQQVASVAGAFVFLIAGVICVHWLAHGVGVLLRDRVGDRYRPVVFAMEVLGYVLLVLGFLGVYPAALSALRPLLVGSAITGVILGIAGQQTFSNFFAGFVLVMARPMQVGEQVIIRANSIGGEYRGEVLNMGFFYVKVLTPEGLVQLPNAGVLGAAIIPAPVEPPPADPAVAEPAGSPATGPAPADPPRAD